MRISRIMREFGLTARSTPVNARAGKIHDALWQDNMDAARIALKQLGFSEFEATNAVLWYVAEDPKDVTRPWLMVFLVGSLPALEKR